MFKAHLLKRAGAAKRKEVRAQKKDRRVAKSEAYLRSLLDSAGRRAVLLCAEEHFFERSLGRRCRHTRRWGSMIRVTGDAFGDHFSLWTVTRHTVGLCRHEYI